MQPHVRIYLEHFGYDESDFIPCEVCSRRSVDIHHLIPRSRIFGEKRNHIDNLMALCRVCHETAHKSNIEEILQKLHQKRLKIG